MNHLINMRFDVAWHGPIPFESLIAKSLGISSVKTISYAPDLMRTAVLS